MACFNALLTKDEDIEASTSSSGVEEAFAGLTQSLKESRQKYEEDKISWDNKLKSSELALHEANKALILAEQTSKAVSTKLEEAERCKTALEAKLETDKELDIKLKEVERRKGELEENLKSFEGVDVKLKETEQCKRDLEEKLRSSEELLKKEISSRAARKKTVAKKYFSAGWDKGWNKALSALSSQMEYARAKFFKDGWVAALRKMEVAENS